MIRQLLALAMMGLVACPALADEITRDPYLQNVTQTGAEVMWGTTFALDSTVTGTLHYGSSPGSYTSSTPSTNAYGVQTTSVAGLSPGQTVYYYIESEGETVGLNDPNYRFSTAPTSDASFRFAAYGDNRSNPTAHSGVVDLIQDNNPDFVVHTGDYVSAGTVEAYETEFFAPAAPLMRNTPLFPSRGNHDTSIAYDYVFDTPANNPAGSELYYSFDYGPAHFICLDTTIISTDPANAQNVWLEGDLAANAQPWTFVFFHHPPYSSGSHGDTVNVQTAWVPLFEEYDVTMVFNGHDHIYDAYLKEDVYYIVTGGGGAPLYSAGPHPPYQIFEDYGIGYHACILDVSTDRVEFQGVDADGTFHTIIIPEPATLTVLMLGACLIVGRRKGK